MSTVPQRVSGFVAKSLSVREHLHTADGHLVRRQLPDATLHYQRALERCAAGDVAERIDALYGLASVQRVRGVVGQAIQFYKEVLALDPTHNDALHSLIHMYVSIDRWEDVEKCELRLLNAIDDQRVLVAELVASGDRWWRGARQLDRAERRYQQAHNLDESYEAASQKLRELATVKRAPSSTAPRHRVSVRPTPAVCPIVQVELQVDERLVGEIDAMAERQGKSRNAIMTLALLHYIDAQRDPPVSCE